jgi:hypothetical protein
MRCSLMMPGSTAAPSPGVALRPGRTEPPPAPPHPRPRGRYPCGRGPHHTVIGSYGRTRHSVGAAWASRVSHAVAIAYRCRAAGPRAMVVPPPGFARAPNSGDGCAVEHSGGCSALPSWGRQGASYAYCPCRLHQPGCVWCQSWPPHVRWAMQAVYRWGANHNLRGTRSCSPTNCPA